MVVRPTEGEGDRPMGVEGVRPMAVGGGPLMAVEWAPKDPLNTMVVMFMQCQGIQLQVGD